MAGAAPAWATFLALRVVERLEPLTVNVWAPRPSFEEPNGVRAVSMRNLSVREPLAFQLTLIWPTAAPGLATTLRTAPGRPAAEADVGRTAEKTATSAAIATAARTAIRTSDSLAPGALAPTARRRPRSPRQG